MKDVEDSEHFHQNRSKEEDIAKDCSKYLILKDTKDYGLVGTMAIS